MGNRVLNLCRVDALHIAILKIQEKRQKLMNPFEFLFLRILQSVQVLWQSFRNVPKAWRFSCNADFRTNSPEMGVVDKAADYLKDAGMAVDILQM